VECKGVPFDIDRKLTLGFNKTIVECKDRTTVPFTVPSMVLIRP